MLNTIFIDEFRDTKFDLIMYYSLHRIMPTHYAIENNNEEIYFF